ncbi:MAG: hypothetical protein RIQ54_321 [Candidatus Parcubacteria bacterium]|jgi:putative ABC transport system ATP-binding protein
MIEARNLIKTYGTGELVVHVLKNLNLTIAEGEFVAIMGPSGAGKSTLLYQLSLLDEPTGGEVHLNGINTATLSQAEKTALRLHQLGYVFQDYALLPELTSLENVSLPMLMQGMSQYSANAKSRQTLERIGMSEKIASLPNQLSGGQQQRVAIARAIAHDPHIVFADEPTANLDSANGRLVMEAFVDLNREGQTIVMVTHEEEYAHYASRVITLKDGQIVHDRTQKK